MRKVFIFGLVFLVLLSSAFGAELYNHGGTSTTDWAYTSPSYDYMSWTFTTTDAWTVNEIDPKIYKSGNPTGVLTMYIYTSDGSRKPDTLVATSTNTMNPSNITTTPTYKPFHFNDIALSASTEYLVVLFSSTVTTSGVGYHRFNRGANASEKQWGSTDGTTWVTQGDNSANFIIYGTAGNPVTPYFTVQASTGVNTTSLTNISIVLQNGSTYTNATGSSITTNINDSRLLNFTVYKGNHPFNVTLLNWNTSSNYDYNLTRITLDVRDLLSNSSISSYDTAINFTYDSVAQSVEFNSITNATFIYANQNQNLTFVTSKSGYFDQSDNLTTAGFTQSFRQYLRPFGSINVNIYDINTTSLLAQSATMLVQNSTNEVEYTIPNGQGAVVGLVGGTEYIFQLFSAGYASNTFTLTYANESEINFYMQQGATEITFNSVDNAQNALEGAKVSIEAFYGGVYTVISEGFTDIVGDYVANLETGITHRVTVSLDGYNSKTFTTQLTSSSYSVTLDESLIFDIAHGTDEVTMNYAPTFTNLTPSNWTFYSNITSTDGNIEYAYLRLWYNGTVLALDNISSSSGGNLQFSYDLTAYNETGVPILLEYGYKLVDYNEINRNYHAYSVTSTSHYTGSLLELRDRMSVKLSIAEKISLFTFVFILLLVVLSVFVTGLINVVVSLGLAILVGWIFGINIILLTLIGLVGIIVTIGYSNRSSDL